MLVVVQQQALAYFTRGKAHDGFRVGVIRGRPIEHFDAKRAFLQVIGFAGQRILDNVLQQSGIAFAVAEVRAGDYRLQLAQDCIPFLRRLRLPGIPS